QDTTDPGNRTAWWATPINQCGPNSTHPASAAAAAGQNDASSITTTPTNNTAATTGAASRLPGHATNRTRPAVPAMIGTVTTDAAAGTVTATAMVRGTRRRVSAADHRGASSTIPAVAATDSANPKLAAMAGS